MDDDFADTLMSALERGFERAFETAVRTGTALVFARNGRIVEVKPPFRYELVPIKKKRRK